MRDDHTLDDQYASHGSTGRSDDVPSSESVGGPRGQHFVRRLAEVSRTRLGDLRNLRAAGFRPAELGPRVREALHQPGRARMALAAGAACCVGLTLVVQTNDGAVDAATPTDAAAVEVVERVESDVASRSRERTAAPTPAAPKPTAGKADPDTRPAPKKPAPRPKPVDPGPVAGLTVAQMNNAKAIVRTGKEMRMPRRALIIAVATAMQESNLYNVASGVLPESQKYPHQGVGWDHDSVGLFQQRSSSGWGPVGKLMDPEFATRQFLTALQQVPGWQRMRLTDAAQAVQVSAFPYHYAKHEPRATVIVDAIAPGWK